MPLWLRTYAAVQLNIFQAETRIRLQQKSSERYAFRISVSHRILPWQLFCAGNIGIASGEIMGETHAFDFDRG